MDFIINQKEIADDDKSHSAAQREEIVAERSNNDD